MIFAKTPASYINHRVLVNVWTSASSTDSVMTWGPYLYTTVRNKPLKTVWCSSDSLVQPVCWLSMWLCSLCWMITAWRTSAVQRTRWRKPWSSSSLRKPRSCGLWPSLWWSRSVRRGSIHSKGQMSTHITVFDAVRAHVPVFGFLSEHQRSQLLQHPHSGSRWQSHRLGRRRLHL